MTYQIGPKLAAQQAMPRRSMFKEAVSPSKPAGRQHVAHRSSDPVDAEPVDDAEFEDVAVGLRKLVDAIPAISPKAEAKRIAKGGKIGVPVLLRLQDAELVRLDGARREGQSRQDAIREILDEALIKSKGP